DVTPFEQCADDGEGAGDAAPEGNACQEARIPSRTYTEAVIREGALQRSSERLGAVAQAVRGGRVQEHIQRGEGRRARQGIAQEGGGMDGFLVGRAPRAGDRSEE